MKVYNWEAAAKRQDKQSQLQPVAMVIKNQSIANVLQQIKNCKEIKIAWYGSKTRTALIKKLKVRQNSTKTKN